MKAGAEVSTLGSLARVACLSRVRLRGGGRGEWSLSCRLRPIAPPIQGVRRAQPQRKSHDWLGAPRSFRSRRDRHLSGAAPARHRRFPAYDRAALRRPREVDPRARGGGQDRRADPARHAEERRRRRSGDQGHLRDRHARPRAAAAEAARLHREGAGRGRRPRQGDGLRRRRGLLSGRGRRRSPRRRARRSRSRRSAARSSASSRAM